MTSVQPHSTFQHLHCAAEAVAPTCSRLCLWTVTSPGKSSSFVILARHLQGCLNRKISGSKQWLRHRTDPVRSREVQTEEWQWRGNQSQLNSRRMSSWIIFYFLMIYLYSDNPGPYGSLYGLDHILKSSLLQQWTLICSYLSKSTALGGPCWLWAELWDGLV